MPRPPNIIPPSRINLGIPQDLHAWLKLHLWSDVEQRVPHSAYQNLITQLLREYREKVERNASVS